MGILTVLILPKQLESFHTQPYINLYMYMYTHKFNFTEVSYFTEFKIGFPKI